MRVTFRLKRPQANYETWIICECHYDSKRVVVYTDLKINPYPMTDPMADPKGNKSLWDKTTRRIKTTKAYPTNPEKNQRLQAIADYAVRIEDKWKVKHKHLDIVPSLPEFELSQSIKDYINKTDPQKRQEAAQKTFWGYFNNLLSRMDNGTRLHTSNSTILAPKTIFQFHNLKRHLQAFETAKKCKIEFESIDMTFYNKFTDYLTVGKNLKPNTIGKLITNLKVVLNEAVNDEVTTVTKFKNGRFKSLSVKSETVYLTDKEINEMLNLELANKPRLERVRDIFIIGCYTGLRFSDLTKIQTANIEDDCIELEQTKTKSTVFVPLRPIAKQLLSKYENNVPKISNQRFNEYLHEVSKLCPSLQADISFNEVKGGKVVRRINPKHELISSHTARRSFATNEYKIGDLTTTEIMSITGHRTEKAFYKYIRETPKDAAMRVKEKWAKRLEIMQQPLMRVV